jgi:HAD superfamily hydrolase (TIGR01450 family)
MPAFLLDMDGVLHHGDKVLLGAVDFVELVADSKHLFITNNPIRSPLQIADRLHSMGFRGILAEQVLTSAQATAVWLSQQKPGFHYFAVGAAGLHDALSELGTEDSFAADYVVIGEGAGLDYASLTTGINLILSRGAVLVVTNPDTSVDAWRNGEHLVLPGGGALVAPFEAATAHEAIIIGKPQPLLYQMAMKRLGVGADECIMIGDRPDTDIAGAAAIGMKTALVRTGRFAPGASWPEGMERPDWDVDSLDELAAELTAAGVFQLFI